MKITVIDESGPEAQYVLIPELEPGKLFYMPF
jgi:hypothetical protein